MKKFLKVFIFIVLLLALISGCKTEDISEENSNTEKIITVEVIKADTKETHTYKTKSEKLGEVLLENKLVSGEIGQYGLFIKTVSGTTADDKKQEWWCITRNGETVFEGADSIKIKDGEKYELTLKIGY